MNTGKAVHSVLSLQGPRANNENFETNDENFANYVLKSEVKTCNMSKATRNYR